MVVPVAAAAARLERLWGFQVEDAGDALVLHRGLLNLSTQRIATGRVQALRIDQPPLWRLLRRFRVVVDVAGYRGATGQQAASVATLLPVAPEDVVRHLVGRLEVHSDLAALRFEPPPRSARLRSLRWRSFGLTWTATHAIVRSGVLWRRTAVVPRQRLQSARATQGPWQRRLGLATLHLDTAGSRVHAAAAHRAVAEAAGLARHLPTAPPPEG